MVCVVMGVTGSGKSTIGALLAQQLGVAYADADEFHSPANIAKMSTGTALTDEDRWQWLVGIGRWLDQRETTGAVATCSALKKCYRDVLRAQAPGLWFLYLAGTAELMTERVTGRRHHFMPPDLVRSQVETLEPPDGEDRVIAEDASAPPDEIVHRFVGEITRRTAG